MSTPPPKKGLSDDQLVLLAHLGTLIGYVIPLGNLLIPLVILKLAKNRLWVADQAAESLNFQLNLTCWLIVGVFSALVMVGFVLIPCFIVYHIVMVVQAVRNRNPLMPFRYPLILRLVG